MSKITVTTIAGVTSGSDANKVKIESGDELNVVNGDLTVDTDTLFVDASADKVGINTTAMDASLEVNSASSKINTLTVKTAAGSGGAGDIIRVHENELNTSATIDANNNGLAAGPLTIASGVTLTINGELSVV